jgi:hypothetical protein
MKLYFMLFEVSKLRREFPDTVLPIISRKRVEKALEGFRQRETTYTAWKLFMMFLLQVASKNSCRKEVGEAISNGLVRRDTSEEDSGYCNARNKLPEETLKAIALQAGRKLASKAAKADLFFGRRVKIIDGSNTRLPDTPANQAEYPQHEGQGEGQGYPIMYFSVLMDLATGAILKVLTSGRAAFENKLFRMMWPCLKAGDIILADANYGSFAEIAMLLRRKVDGVFHWDNTRKHRPKVKIFSENDWLETWEKPKVGYPWVDSCKLPEFITVRVISFQCRSMGYRPDKIEIVTTLLDPKRYPREILMKLYARRWEMEMRLDDIKTVMKLDELTCKTPSRCRKELYMGFLAYNLIRTVMLDAAYRAGIQISRISFTGTRDRLGIFGSGLLVHKDSVATYILVLEHLAHDILPFRPDRFDVRCIKKRQNKYPFLNQPRHAACEALLSC